MAALALSVAGSAAGGSLFGPTGAIARHLIGAVADNAIDLYLFGGRHTSRDAPRLSNLTVMASTDGTRRLQWDIMSALGHSLRSF